MFRNPDDQIQQDNRQYADVMRQLLGVTSEDQYFARQEAERSRKPAGDRCEQAPGEEGERETALHSMKCPKCGLQLEEVAFGEVRVDRCLFCEGLWLEKGELDLIRPKEGGFMGRVLRVLR